MDKYYLLYLEYVLLLLEFICNFIHAHFSPADYKFPKHDINQFFNERVYEESYSGSLRL